MGLWSTLTGRSKPVQANLDALFALPAAAITLQTAAGFTPTGLGSVCYRAAEGSENSASRFACTGFVRPVMVSQRPT